MMLVRAERVEALDVGLIDVAAVGAQGIERGVDLASSSSRARWSSPRRSWCAPTAPAWGRRLPVRGLCRQLVDIILEVDHGWRSKLV